MARTGVRQALVDVTEFHMSSHGQPGEQDRTPREYTGKRTFDLILVFSLAPLILPVVGLISVLVKLEDGGDVLFGQRRLGAGGSVFTCYKFRSMVEGAEQRGTGLRVTESDSRITRVGRVIRRWGLDELPQLWNVLKGDMSVVGPRPALVRDLERYDAEECRRLQARPGLAGWAWIHGRRSIPWAERYALDVWYVDHMSFALDLRILFRAFRILLGGKGLYPSEAVLEESRRNEDES